MRSSKALPLSYSGDADSAIKAPDAFKRAVEYSMLRTRAFHEASIPIANSSAAPDEAKSTSPAKRAAVPNFRPKSILSSNALPLRISLISLVFESAGKNCSLLTFGASGLKSRLSGFSSVFS